MFTLRKDKIITFDSEFNIEDENVIAVDRAVDNETCISYYDKNGANVECFLLTTIDKHNDYINRLRMKLNIDTVGYRSHVDMEEIIARTES